MPWYAVHVKSKQDDRVSARFAQTGLDVFLPKIAVPRRRRGARTCLAEPLFPGYLFISVNLTAQTWNTIRWTPGVRAIVGCDGIPSPIPDAPIAVIKQRTAEDGVIQPIPTFTHGDRVRVTDGPLADLVGILEGKVSRSGRVRVLLEILRGATIELDDVDIELAS